MSTSKKIVGFNYECLDNPQAASAARTAAADIRGKLTRSSLDIIEIGRQLLLIRQLLRKRFPAWLKAEFEWPQSTASNYMAAATKFGDEADVKNIQPYALRFLVTSRVTQPAVREALQRAGKGELITAAIAKQIMRKHGCAPEQAPGPKPGPKPASPVDKIRGFIDSLIRERPAAELSAFADALFQLAAELKTRGASGTRPEAPAGDASTGKGHAPAPSGRPHEARKPRRALAAAR
jgi:hypothetical protein